MRVCWLCLLGWLGAPGVHGRCCQPRKQSLLWLSCYLREPLLKKLHYPICSLSFTQTLYLHSGQDSVIVVAYILSLIPFSSLETVKVGHIRKSGPHTWGIPLRLSEIISPFRQTWIIRNVPWRPWDIWFCSDYLSLGDTWFEVLEENHKWPAACQDEVYEAWIKARFLSDWWKQC